MDKRLLDILVCPATKGKLVLKGTEPPAGITPAGIEQDQKEIHGDSSPDQSQDKTEDKVENVAQVELELWSRSAGLAYPVIDGIPHMVENEARTLTNEEIASLKESHK